VRHHKSALANEQKRNISELAPACVMTITSTANRDSLYCQSNQAHWAAGYFQFHVEKI
jgi:hypothetical protein